MKATTLTREVRNGVVETRDILFRYGLEAIEDLKIENRGILDAALKEGNIEGYRLTPIREVLEGYYFEVIIHQKII